MLRRIALIFVLPALMLLLLTALGRPAPAVGAEEGKIPLETLTLSARDFQDGEAEGLRRGGDGMTLAPGRDRAVYVSPELTAPIPFNTLVPRWQGEGLGGEAGMRLYLRSGDPLSAAEWVEVPVDDDMTLPEDEFVTGSFYFLPEMDQTHRRFQIRVDLARTEEMAAPRLEEIQLTFIDSSAAPTPAEAINRQRELGTPEIAATPDGRYPKPFVVTRAVWCDKDEEPACDYSDGLRYHPVSHLILHHTVTPEGSNPIAALQSIWKYHTFTRGWGDIGYNYLVDSSGVLYEGHLGGDNVVGTHSGDANSGSMALSMIGDFTNVQPSAATQNAIVDLFAWKADQMNIDVYDSSILPYMDWGLPHLIGHRDVYGNKNTACPGDSAHPLLPAIRDEVARRIGFTPDHFYFDELAPQSHFVKSTRPGDDYWWDSPRGCGFNTHAYYTWSVTKTVKSTNWAVWQPEVPFTGRYDIDVYAPYCNTGRADTAGAVYEVTHLEGTSRREVDQGANAGVWVSLGTYDLAAGTSNQVRLTDLTATDAHLGVWFDAIRLRPLRPAVSTPVPADGSWLATSGVNFHWSLINGNNVAQQTFQLATDPGFTHRLLDLRLASSTRSLSQNLADGVYFWRIVLRDSDGETIYAPGQRIGVDTVPPVSTVTRIYELQDGRVLVVWEGEDAQSGIVGYNIEYRAEGTEEWRSWLRDTRQTSAFFTPSEPERHYWFRSQAEDSVGWLETFPQGPGDISSSERVLLDEHLSLPVIARSARK